MATPFARKQREDRADELADCENETGDGRDE
jgi:hypothetical protein